MVGGRNFVHRTPLTSVRVQLPQSLGAGSLDIVHGANVIQTTTGHQVTRRGEGNTHHPSRF